MRRVLLGFVALVGLYGCYDYSVPADGDGDDDAKTKQNGSSDPINPSSVGNNKTPTSGDAPVLTPGGGTSTTTTTTMPATDAGTDAATTTTTTTTGNGCASNGMFCGGDKLLKCNADNSRTFIGKCANGCANGACNTATKCVPGGSYCGGDKVNGEPDVLYNCGADGFATTVQMRCTNGCVIATAGSDDYCN